MAERIAYMVRNNNGLFMNDHQKFVKTPNSAYKFSTKEEADKFAQRHNAKTVEKTVLN